MVSVRIATCLAAFAAAVSAAPVLPAENALTYETLNVTDTADRTLRNGERVVFGNGRTTVVSEATYKLLLKLEGVSAETPEIDWDYIKSGEKFAGNYRNGTSLDKRDCSNDISYTVDTKQRFVDWDVQMSPVIIGAGNHGIDITISKSWTVSNGITVSGGFDPSSLYSKLGASFGVDYSRVWTTSQGYLVRATVDDGQTGVVITEPWVNRKYGRTFQGCPGSLRQVGTFMADSHEDGSYEGVSWVSGAITGCIKSQSSIPLTRCHGSGAFR
ncbi:hypothetical protein MCOR02_004891 [Pyricularia oryzae]|uniref:Uncharacterized protein n=1 Tax=Pyricularia oryzae (strain 70-15 / ATCC MYA-4617 / FGSC 8958) TaxID=242507 RepID=G4MPM6_PYRO7|nr:uncharacterized protein MGG_02222 [Pyricularia oryzae 70-15]EHA56375.1 hypothetical protein MGG_02222 [Pyricularia oryzae 70-15]KAH9435981.1 hypothetical protein MCOR02_004891 [Pyricularia oryzae]KAI6481160.1 hypothetical protein MCOR13_010941 [Pyricularia oryzae]KAI6482303.1 hypothetical protein MCOR11_011029 [Pyricularia oryzae]